MNTHGNIIWININSHFAYGASWDNVILTVAALFHIDGLNVMSLHSLRLGSTLALMRNFDPNEVLSTFDAHEVKHMFGGPGMFLFLSQHGE